MAPAYGWVELDDLRGFVRDHLQKSQTEALKPNWESICRGALQAAYGYIVRAFAMRGYTKAQIDQWDFGEEYQRDIAAWIALKRLAVISPDNAAGQRALDSLDRRKELVGDPKDDIPAALMMIDGEVVDPAGDFGQIHVGTMDTSEDMFVMPTSSDDSRIGEVSRF